MTYANTFEWRLAAQWWGKSWDEFIELDGEIQSDMVATYRAQRQLEAVLDYYAHIKRISRRRS